MKKIALIFGITGQDGSYLLRFLLKKNYKVYGVIRRSSSFNTHRIDDLYADTHKSNHSFKLLYGDLTDGISTQQIIQKVMPDEIYNLGAQSHVKVSFEIPEYTANTNAIGPLRILEVIRQLSRIKKIKYYQAGTSEMFGKTLQKKQNEKTNFYPRSPYGASKLYAHWVVINYRESYGIFACNGILFNHESPYRGETFITKKIITGLCNIKFNKDNKLYLGNLYAKRDWGHANDYVEAMWKMLQQKTPDDYVVATGKTHTVKKFINLVAKKLDMQLTWKGKGLNEKAIWKEKNRVIIEIDKSYFRPTEVDYLCGNYSKALKKLKWKPKKTLNDLIDEMIGYQIKKINENFFNRS